MGEMSQYAGLPYLKHDDAMPMIEQVCLFEQALTDHPEDELKILRFLVPFSSMVKEKLDSCLEWADRLVQLAETEHDKSEALYWRAAILFEDRRNVAEAEAIFLQIIEKQPDHDGVLEQLFQVYMSTKQYDKAMQWAEAMYQLEGAEHCGLLNKGEVLLAQDRVDEALAAYKAILPLDTHLSYAYFGMASCYVELEQWELAKDAFIEAFERCHHPHELYAYGAGLCYQNMDDPYRAMQWYGKSLEIDPSFPNALNNMAVLQLDLENGWREAVPYLLKAVELSGEAINQQMRIVYRNLWAYYKQILDEEKAEYYHRLNYKCLGFDDDNIDFLDSFGEE
ncbi:MAG: tetratricopeptide repeat protein [Flavobacteriales bacterium]|nr:tetratricopeptide repeat protein [Flavobacteriales bacterium]